MADKPKNARIHYIKCSQEEYEELLVEDRHALVREDRGYRVRTLIEVIELDGGRQTGRRMQRIITCLDFIPHMTRQDYAGEQDDIRKAREAREAIKAIEKPEEHDQREMQRLLRVANPNRRGKKIAVIGSRMVSSMKEAMMVGSR